MGINMTTSLFWKLAFFWTFEVRLNQLQGRDYGWQLIDQFRLRSPEHEMVNEMYPSSRVSDQLFYFHSKLPGWDLQTKTGMVLLDMEWTKRSVKNLNSQSGKSFGRARAEKCTPDVNYMVWNTFGPYITSNHKRAMLNHETTYLIPSLITLSHKLVISNISEETGLFDLYSDKFCLIVPLNSKNFTLLKV